jgi:hypothetical protein
MTETTLQRALDGAHAVVFSDSLPVFVVWSGGTTFNVYSTGPADEPPVREVDVFTVSDGEGGPLSREEAVQHMNDYAERAANG